MTEFITGNPQFDVTLAGALPRDPGDGMVAVALAKSELAALGTRVRALDESTGGIISRAIVSRDFTGARDETLHLTGPAGTARRILLVGLGDPADRKVALRRGASIGARRAREAGLPAVWFVADNLDPDAVEFAATGLFAGAWDYTPLKTPPPAVERKPLLQNATVVVEDSPANRGSLDVGRAIGMGQSLTRTLGVMPGNICTPEYLGETAVEIASRNGMKVTVQGRSELESEGMRSMLAVAQGTPQDPKLIILEYNGAAPDAQPVVLIGKGLCFDSGGISIKPADNMEYMKFDMSGGGAVLGAMEAIGRIKPKVNVVGIVGATTNMPSGTALKPGDVIQAHSGRFIEIINTDAEGRLVLADLLSYARRFNPAAVIDAATLTGAVVIALGNVATGVFGGDAPLVQEVLAAGRAAGEPSWELPLWEDFRELIKSDVADSKNSGGRAASSISAALFLKDFAEGYPWVHMDIAGTAYRESDMTAIPKGPTGVPVCTFVHFVRARSG